jgi:glutamate formiminotransferase
MRILTVPNWSFGRDKLLLRRFEEILSDPDIQLHYLESDIDHNRTVSGFSGEFELVGKKILQLAAEAFDSIDLNRHTGVHPRIGALDVCPFVSAFEPLTEEAQSELNSQIRSLGELIAETFEVPVFLYEKSEAGRHEADLPTLRKGGFGGLLERDLNPDFGPNRAHPRLGATVLGLRDFLIAMNVHLREPSGDHRIALRTARMIRDLRNEGDERFLGVRALGFFLPSRNLSQVSLNLTLPDLTPVDPIVDFIRQEASIKGCAYAGSQLIGVIRRKDLVAATHLPVKPEQVVDLDS